MKLLLESWVGNIIATVMLQAASATYDPILSLLAYASYALTIFWTGWNVIRYFEKRKKKDLIDTLNDHDIHFIQILKGAKKDNDPQQLLDAANYYIKTQYPELYDREGTEKQNLD